jgi:hypothetical protein
MMSKLDLSKDYPYQEDSVRSGGANLAEYFRALILDLRDRDNDMAERINNLMGYQGSDTWNPANLAAGGYETKEVTVNGASIGDFAVGALSIDIADLILDVQVTAENTATCILYNPTAGAINLAEATVRVRVWPK